MRFTPKTEQEIASENLLPVGTYDFEIISAEETTSKASGNEMIKLTVRVFDEDGTSRQLFDYLMEQVAYKLRHCAEVCGLLSDYESGHLDPQDFVGKTGKCKVNIQKDKSGQYPDRNGISDYLRQETTIAAAALPVARTRKAAPAPASDLDDEIPF